MTSAPGTQDDAQTRAPDHRDDGMVAHRVALVTGGTRGIGAAVSRALAQEGASVAAGYWHNQEAAEKFAASMRADYPGQKLTTHAGHPIGATGTILAVKTLYELRRTGGRYGLVTMCIGGGQGIAAIFERL